MSILRPLAKKWKEIGKVLKVTDDVLGEVTTNVATDEDCLVKVMDHWVKYCKPSWKKLARALKVMDEDEIALKCHKKGEITKYIQVCVSQWLE